MRLADGSVHPAWTVPVATAKGVVVSTEPTDRRDDGGLAPSPVEQIMRRCGQTPVRLLADGTAMTVQDIAALRSVCHFQGLAHNLLHAYGQRCVAA